MVSLPSPVLRLVTVRTPARTCVPSIVIVSAPEPVQYVMPSANVPFAAAL
jgi:hypothetical protein